MYCLSDYVAVKAKVRPHANNTDPVTKLKFYNCSKKSEVKIKMTNTYICKARLVNINALVK